MKRQKEKPKLYAIIRAKSAKLRMSQHEGKGNLKPVGVSWRPGLVAPQQAVSSRSRDRTHVPCTGRRIPTHRTTRGVLPAG